MSAKAALEDIADEFGLNAMSGVLATKITKKHKIELTNQNQVRAGNDV